MNQPNQEFDRKVQRGTRLVLAAQVGSQLISLVVIAVLYRLVDQESFGLIGMVGPWMMLLRLLATNGIGVATIQESSLTHSQLTSLFWFNLLLGIAATGATWGGSFGLAFLYGADRLPFIGAMLAGTTLVAAIGSQHLSLLERHMRFGTVSAIRLCGQLGGGIAAVSVAVGLYVYELPGFWALIAQQYVELTINLLGAWWKESWRPGRPTWFRNITGLIKFGGYYGGANIIFFLSRNVDKVALSLLFGDSPSGRAVIGMYSQAFNQMLKPVQLISSPLIGILLPALAKARNDSKLYESLTIRFFTFASLGMVPSAFGLLVVAEDGFALLGGDEWRAAGKLLEALALTIAVQGPINLCGTVLASRGNARVLFVGSLTMLGCLSVSLITAACWMQLTSADALTAGLVMAWTFSGTSLLVAPVYVATILGLAKIRRREMLKQLFPVYFYAGIMAAIVAALNVLLQATDLNNELRLAIVIAVGVVSYSILARKRLVAAARQTIWNR